MHDGSESRALQYESLRDVGSRTLRGIPAYADAAVVAIGERSGCGIGRAVIGDSPARVANEALCGAAVEDRLTHYGAVIVDSVRREGRAVCGSVLEKFEGAGSLGLCLKGKRSRNDKQDKQAHLIEQRTN